MDVDAIEQAITTGQFLFTEHALLQMSKRQLTELEVRQVLASPDEVLSVREGRIVAHGMLGNYLLRVFMDVDRNPLDVVTAYRTSKIDRYRSQP